MTRRFVLGLDLGPASAFTALAVVERADDESGKSDPTFAVRHLQRFPPGTQYRAIVASIGELLDAKALIGSPVAVDVTAVGTGVLDLLRTLSPEPELVPVVVTAGHHAEYGPHGAWLVPKKDLVTGLQLLLQGRRLAIPSGLPEADLLARELANFRAKVSLAADPLQAEWREGRDDDLVLAVALGCWQAGRLSGLAVEWGPVVTTVRRGPFAPRAHVPLRWPWW